MPPTQGMSVIWLIALQLVLGQWQHVPMDQLGPVTAQLSLATKWELWPAVPESLPVERRRVYGMLLAIFYVFFCFVIIYKKYIFLVIILQSRFKFVCEWKSSDPQPPTGPVAFSVSSFDFSNMADPADDLDMCNDNMC